MITLLTLLGFFVLLGCAVGDPSTSSTCSHSKTASLATKNFDEVTGTSLSTPFVSTTLVVTLAPVNGSLSMVQSETTADLSTESCVDNGSCTLSTLILSEPFTISLTTTVSRSRTITLTTTTTEGTATSTTEIVPISEVSMSKSFPDTVSSNAADTVGTSATNLITSTTLSTVSISASTSLASADTTSTDFVTPSSITMTSSMAPILTSTDGNGTVVVPEHTPTCNFSLVSPIPPVSQGIPVPATNQTWTFVTPITSATTTYRHGGGATSVRPPTVFCVMMHAMSFVRHTMGDNLAAAVDTIFENQVTNTASSDAHTEDLAGHDFGDGFKKFLKNVLTLFIPSAPASLKVRELSTGNGTFTPWWTSVRVSTVTQPSTVTITSTTLSTTYAYLTNSPTVNITEYVTVNVSSALTTTYTETSPILTSDRPHTGPAEGAPSSQASDAGSSGFATSAASGGKGTWMGFTVGTAFLVTVLPSLYVTTM